MTIVALDPGGTTGVAIKQEGTSPSRFQVDTSTPEGLEEIYYTLLHESPIEVVMERFQFRYGGGRAKVVLTPVEVIGVVKLYCALKKVKLYEQTPSQAKKFITDEKMRMLDLWIPGLPHAMDATRHLLYHLIVTKRDQRWLELLRKNN